MSQPNVLFVFADQWRAQAFGYAGNKVVQTPNIDALAEESLVLRNAVPSSPVCTPYRASLLTGQYPLTHGLFLNDAPLHPKGQTLGEAFHAASYNTAYVGKWHVNAGGRLHPVPPDRHFGFDYWKVCECTHDYNHSLYFEGDDPTPKVWDGYDAQAQTRDVCTYLRNRTQDKPFLMVLSWGPPHAPYETAPEAYRQRYQAADIELRPNVPKEAAEAARAQLAGYYAHCTALDDCMAELLACLDETGLADDTILVFTSDHGDMIGSQGQWKKQRPWAESVRVPFLLRYPRLFGRKRREINDKCKESIESEIYRKGK